MVHQKIVASALNLNECPRVVLLLSEPLLPVFEPYRPIADLQSVLSPTALASYSRGQEHPVVFCRLLSRVEFYLHRSRHCCVPKLLLETYVLLLHFSYPDPSLRNDALSRLRSGHSV